MQFKPEQNTLVDQINNYLKKYDKPFRRDLRYGKSKVKALKELKQALSDSKSTNKSESSVIIDWENKYTVIKNANRNTGDFVNKLKMKAQEIVTQRNSPPNQTKPNKTKPVVAEHPSEPVVTEYWNSIKSKIPGQLNTKEAASKIDKVEKQHLQYKKNLQTYIDIGFTVPDNLSDMMNMAEEKLAALLNEKDFDKINDSLDELDTFLIDLNKQLTTDIKSQSDERYRVQKPSSSPVTEQTQAAPAEAHIEMPPLPKTPEGIEPLVPVIDDIAEDLGKFQSELPENQSQMVSSQIDKIEEQLGQTMEHCETYMELDSTFPEEFYHDVEEVMKDAQDLLSENDFDEIEKSVDELEEVLNDLNQQFSTDLKSKSESRKTHQTDLKQRLTTMKQNRAATEEPKIEEEQDFSPKAGG